MGWTPRAWLPLAAALGVAIVALPLCVSGAEARTMQQKLAAACATDARTLCALPVEDSDRLKACLLARRAEVSPACMALIDASE